MSKTYLLTGNYEESLPDLKPLLDKNGWNQLDINKKIYYVDLLFFFHRKDNCIYEHSFYNVTAKLQNILSKNDGIEKITNKRNLYFRMLNEKPTICKNHLMKTTEFSYNFKLEKGKVYIIKPVGIQFCGGKGIIIIKNKQELDNFITDKKANSYIISEYMQNPLLYDKKKFHFRVHLLLSNINKKTNYHFFDTLRIITAPENYKNSDYTNSRIHDSHIKFSDDIILNSKKQLDKLNITEKDFINIKKQINLIIKTVYKIAKPYIKPYETIENAFELLGCDFMVDSNLNVYLLEVNDHISYKFHDPTRRDVINFRKRLTNFIYNKTVKKLI